MLSYDNAAIASVQERLGDYKNTIQPSISSEMPVIIQVKVENAANIWLNLDDTDGYAAYGRVMKGILQKLCCEIPNCRVGMFQWDTLTFLIQPNADKPWMSNAVSRIVSKVVSVAAMQFNFLWKKEVDYADWFWCINLQLVGVEFTTSVFNIASANILALFQLEQSLALRTSLETFCTNFVNNGTNYIGAGLDPEVLRGKLRSANKIWSDMPKDVQQGYLCVPSNSQRYELEYCDTCVEQQLEFLSDMITPESERAPDWRDMLTTAFLQSF